MFPDLPDINLNVDLIPAQGDSIWTVLSVIIPIVIAVIALLVSFAAHAESQSARKTELLSQYRSLRWSLKSNGFPDEVVPHNLEVSNTSTQPFFRIFVVHKRDGNNFIEYPRSRVDHLPPGETQPKLFTPRSYVHPSELLLVFEDSYGQVWATRGRDWGESALVDRPYFRVTVLEVSKGVTPESPILIKLRLKKHVLIPSPFFLVRVWQWIVSLKPSKKAKSKHICSSGQCLH